MDRMMPTGRTRGGMQRHAAREEEPERSYCGYLIPDDRSDTEEVSCKVCREQVALTAGAVE